MKKKYIIAMLLMLLTLTFVLITFFALKTTEHKGANTGYDLTEGRFEILNSNKENFINDNKTALTYGTLLLKSAFPEYFEHNEDMEFEAFELSEYPISDSKVYKNVWKVYTVVECGRNEVCFGGDVYVVFKKSGEIINFDLGL